MHGFEGAPAVEETSLSTGPWWKELNRYHWFVLLVSVLGWLFDTMDQQLFNLARGPAILELHGPQDAQFFGGLATTIFMLGWASGGIVFGIMGDRYGRAKTMVITILLYSMFTGLSAASVGYWDFVFYRFLTGLGVGGEFAVGIALVAETMPDRARPHALGWLQACSAIGNITAAFVSMGLAPLEAAEMLGEWKPWRYMFVIGALPALLALAIRRRLQEPEKWKAMRADKTQKLGSIAELLGTPWIRKRAIVGLLLSTSGVVGLWGIGFFSFELVRSVFRKTFEAEARAEGGTKIDSEFVRSLLQHPHAMGDTAKLVANANAMVVPEAKALYGAALKLGKESKPVSLEAVLEFLDQDSKRPQSAEDRELRRAFAAEPIELKDGKIPHVDAIKARNKKLESRLTFWAGVNGLLLNIGAFFGIYGFSKLTQRTGRKPAFALAFSLAFVATASVFWCLTSFSHVFWMIPIMGFCQLSLFGGYAIYLPELFPTRLRSTGTSFCYNVGRYLAAAGPLLLGYLADKTFGHHGEVMAMRYAGVTMCVFFLLGLVVLPFAPETKGQPLPE